MQEDYINGGQTGLHSESLSQTKQKCIFLKDIHFICLCVCEYEHTEAMAPEDLNSVHRACMMSPFISLSQLSSLQVILKGKNNVFDFFEGRERVLMILWAQPIICVVALKCELWAVGLSSPAWVSVFKMAGQVQCCVPVL